MPDLSIPIDINKSNPIYEQIYIFIKNEIRSGKLAYGVKLPSTRILSKKLIVSRSTVQLAYDQLVSEGYIEALPCKGYFVQKIDGLYNIEVNHKIADKEDKKSAVEYIYDFSPAGIELDNFPYNAWRKVMKNVLAEKERDLFNIGDGRGEYELRVTIASYLHESRGVNCSPDNIIVGAGMEYLLGLLDQLITNANGRNVIYAMENPSYRKAYMILKGMGRLVEPVNLDENGMKPDELLDSRADVAYVTPSHQYPLGIIMSIGRRMELLNWAKAQDNRYIIEDDYDSEFRYKGKPIPSLQGIDNAQKVIYTGTFSKSIAPGIRMGYMVLPDRLMEWYNRIGAHYSNTVSRIDQNIVNAFINEGYYERHLNKMRAIYKTKHDRLLSCLKNLGADYQVSGESAGLHVLVTTKTLSEKELVDRAHNVGIKVYPLSAHYLKADEHEEATVILGYARLSLEQIEAGVAKIAEAWKVKKNGEDM